VRIRLAGAPGDLDGADLIVLPGSKNTAEDLAWLRRTGLGEAVVAAAAAGRPVLGVCGGYQMLGVAVHDPHGVESAAGTTRGLGLLAVETWLEPQKTTVRVRARVTTAPGPFAGAAGSAVDAYEIHVGRTVAGGLQPAFEILARQGRAVTERDGASSDGGTVVGTYLHGLFANDGLRRALLASLATRRGLEPDTRWGAASSATARYDRLADVVAGACDLAAIGKLVGLDLGRGETRHGPGSPGPGPRS
jgi:adenosylcobyric acid synthase